MSRGEDDHFTGGQVTVDNLGADMSMTAQWYSYLEYRYEVDMNIS